MQMAGFTTVSATDRKFLRPRRRCISYGTRQTPDNFFNPKFVARKSDLCVSTVMASPTYILYLTLPKKTMKQTKISRTIVSKYSTNLCNLTLCTPLSSVTRHQFLLQEHRKDIFKLPKKKKNN